MSTDERLERLTNIVDSPASSVVAHDSQIDAMIQVGERHQAQLARLTTEVTRVAGEIANLTHQWQACLNRLPSQ
jgi:hypothetical protein